MSDENSELDEIDSSVSINSELEHIESVSNASSSPPRTQEQFYKFEENLFSSNVVQNLFRREIGFGSLSRFRHAPLRSYHLRNLFPQQVLLSHVFMGMSKCGRFLITYTMNTDQDDDEWYATVYKYRLHWWTFKPAAQARKIAEVSLFGNYKIVSPLQIYLCQWPQDCEKILAYGLMKESCLDASVATSNQHAFVTVTALPSVDNCQDCRVVASSYKLDDIAASWDTCLQFSCLKHGYTVHTSFDVVVPYPEFIPKINLKCHDFAVFNTNNFLYALKVDLEHCERKAREETEDVDYLIESCGFGPAKVVLEEVAGTELTTELTSSQSQGLRMKEQIIRDFSEEIVLHPMGVYKRGSEEMSCEGETKCSLKTADQEGSSLHSPSRFHPLEDLSVRVREGLIEKGVMSPPLPTRVVNVIEASSSQPKVDCFRQPLKATVKRGLELRKTNAGDRTRFCKPFFTKHKMSRGGISCTGVLLRHCSLPELAKPLFKQPRLSPLRCQGAADTTYEFVDDSHNEVEKLSHFRRKRLADKKYEFQDFDSENIVPFSIVRQENTLRSPPKLTPVEGVTEADHLAVFSGEMPEQSPSPKFSSGMDLSVSVPSPRSPLIIEVLSSPPQVVEGVLRPLNRNTGHQLPSPMARPHLGSPSLPPHKPAKLSFKAKSCDGVSLLRAKAQPDDVKQVVNYSPNDTRAFLNYGILIHDISERYSNASSVSNIYENLTRHAGKLQGQAVRFSRRFVEVDDELVSVITDVEDDDMSVVTGYHTALNVEVHGAGYEQLQMISNSKAEKLSAPCVVLDQQSLDIEAVCHVVATSLCHVAGMTFTFCSDYDVEVVDVCPRSCDVLVLLMMRIEGSEDRGEQVSQLKYEASVTFTWNLLTGEYKVCTVVPPQRVNWAWDDKAVWNPARKASRRFRAQLPSDVTLCEPSVRVIANTSTLGGISLSHIQDLENGVQFVL